MAPAIVSAEICPCGTEMEYRGANKNFLHCSHCDEGCLIQRDLKEPCLRCEAFNDYWKKQIDADPDYRNPGKAY